MAEEKAPTRKIKAQRVHPQPEALKEWISDAVLYQLSEPVEWEGVENSGKTRWVIASAVIAPLSGAEVYLFPSNPNGEPLSMLEMPGSLRGTLQHEKALLSAGWEVAND